MPEGCTLFAYIRDGKALQVRPETQFRGGDKVIVIGRREWLAYYQLLEDHPELARPDITRLPTMDALLTLAK